MKRRILALSAVALAVTTSSPSAQETETLSEPSATDYSDAQKLIAPIIDNLVSQNAEQAVNAAFSEGPLAERAKPQLPNLIGQLNTLYQIYGPIAACEPATRSQIGRLAIKYTYHCQHENYVTKWDFSLLKTANGWIIATFRFSDAEI